MHVTARAVAVLFLSFAAPHALAQCSNTWTAVGALPSSARALAVLPNGHPVAAGLFTFGTTFTTVAEWNGTAWAPLGGGVSGTVNAMLTLPNGDLLVGGFPSTAGGVTVGYVARWDGTTWSAFGSSQGDFSNGIQTMHLDANGDVVVGGYFHPYRWDGTAWVPLGGNTGPSSNGLTSAFTRLRNGNLIAAGAFNLQGGAPGPFPHNIGLWDGTAWFPLGPGQLPGAVDDVVELPNGDLVAVGSYPNGGFVCRWDGTNWTTMNGTGTWFANGRVSSVTLLPNDQVLIGGEFTTVSGVSVTGLGRWDGTTWVQVGPGTAGRVLDEVALPNGELLLGGSFTTFGGGPAYLARLGTTCPASAVAVGLGCPSSGGNNALTARNLPWVEATFRAESSGLPGLGIVFAVTSFTAIPQGALPLAAVLAPAAVGCDLLVAPDLVQAYVATTGSVESSFFLPNTPPIVGLSFFHQHLPFELDPLGNVTQITATNALQLTAGAF